MPPLSIKLWFIKQFGKELYKSWEAMNFMRTKFPKRGSTVKITERIFGGPQVQQLLNLLKLKALFTIVFCSKNGVMLFSLFKMSVVFLRNIDSYIQFLVKDLITKFWKTAVLCHLKFISSILIQNFSLKICLMYLMNTERDNQEIIDIEARYKGKFYCWCLLCDSKFVSYKRSCMSKRL